MEQKAAIDVGEIDEAELHRLLGEYGYSLLSYDRLKGGFSSTNVRCELQGTAGRRTLMLKMANADHALEDIELQVQILLELQRHNFPTNYLHPRTAGGFIARGQQIAVLLDFVPGVTGDKLLAQHLGTPQNTRTINASLGRTLAALHRCELHTSLPPPLRGIRAGFPVSNTGDLLQPGKAEAQLASPLVSAHPFAAFVLERLPRVRQIYASAEEATLPLPQGLIHGDAYLDNALYSAETLQLAALVDWEDACVAPLVLDIAAAMAGNCFGEGNRLEEEWLLAILEGYASERPLSNAEVLAIPDFLWAAVLACAAWRFVNFNLDKPESPDEAKKSYECMQQRLQVLEAADLSFLATQLGEGE